MWSRLSGCFAEMAHVNLFVIPLELKEFVQPFPVPTAFHKCKSLCCGYQKRLPSFSVHHQLNFVQGKLENLFEICSIKGLLLNRPPAFRALSRESPSPKGPIDGHRAPYATWDSTLNNIWAFVWMYHHHDECQFMFTMNAR